MKIEIQELEVAIEGYGNELAELDGNIEAIKADITAKTDALNTARVGNFLILHFH